MISVFDMSSGELLHQDRCEDRRVSKRHGAGRPDLGGDREVASRTHRDERERSLPLELALLPVAATARR